MDKIYEEAKKSNFDYSAFVFRNAEPLNEIPFSRSELYRLLFNYMGEASTVEAIGGCQGCMQPLEGDEDVFILPGCCHVVHKNCFLELVTTSLNCPACKRNVRLGLLQAVCEKVRGFSPVLNISLEAKSTFEEED